MTPDPSAFDTLESSPAAKEPAEDRIVEQRIARCRLDPRSVNVDDRGSDLLHHRREGEAHLAWTLRRDFGRCLGERGSPYEREGENERQPNQTEPPIFPHGR